MEGHTVPWAAASVRRTALVLSTGYILYFFSEVVFWSDPGRTPLGEVVVTWLAYSLLAFVLLDLVGRFRAETVWGVFLAGAVVGWLAEGVVAQTLYENLPFSISFTALAWHASVSVLAGWYLIGRALTEGRGWQLLATCVALGLFWAVWAIWWWVESDRVAPVGTFARHAVVTSLPFVACHLIQARVGWTDFRPGRTTEIAVGALFVVGFGFAVLAAPVALVVLPVLLGGSLVALRRHRASGLASPGEPAVPRLPSRAVCPFLTLLLIPIVATAVYASAYAADLRLQTGWGVYVVSTAAGAWLFVQAVRRSGRSVSAATEPVAS